MSLFVSAIFLKRAISSAARRTASHRLLPLAWGQIPDHQDRVTLTEWRHVGNSQKPLGKVYAWALPSANQQRCGAGSDRRICADRYSSPRPGSRPARRRLLDGETRAFRYLSSGELLFHQPNATSANGQMRLSIICRRRPSCSGGSRKTSRYPQPARQNADEGKITA
jgi:hypothetical protein